MYGCLFIITILFTAIQVAQGDALRARLVLSYDQSKGDLLFHRQLQTHAQSMPAEINLDTRAMQAGGLRDLQRIRHVLRADGDDDGLRFAAAGQAMLGKQSQQPLDAKGEAARFDGARPADSLHESVITPAAADLCIVATGILRVYLEDQPGVIADAAPKRQVQGNALAWDAVLLHHRYELFQFCERRGIDLVAAQNIAQRSKRLRGRTGGAVKFAQQVE